MRSRKHRIVVEVTFSKELTEDKAVKGLRLALDTAGVADSMSVNPIWANASDVYVEKVRVKSFSRVLRGMIAAADKYVEVLFGKGAKRGHFSGGSSA